MKVVFTNKAKQDYDKLPKHTQRKFGEVLTKYRFSSIFGLNGKLLGFVDDYNQNKRLKNLNYKTPVQYLKETKNIILRIVS